MLCHIDVKPLTIEAVLFLAPSFPWTVYLTAPSLFVSSDEAADYSALPKAFEALGNAIRCD